MNNITQAPTSEIREELKSRCSMFVTWRRGIKENPGISDSVIDWWTANRRDTAALVMELARREPSPQDFGNQLIRMMSPDMTAANVDAYLQTVAAILQKMTAIPSLG